jgi:hypothetical protein
MKIDWPRSNNELEIFLLNLKMPAAERVKGNGLRELFGGRVSRGGLFYEKTTKVCLS